MLCYEPNRTFAKTLCKTMCNALMCGRVAASHVCAVLKLQHILTTPGALHNLAVYWKTPLCGSALVHDSEFTSGSETYQRKHAVNRLVLAREPMSRLNCLDTSAGFPVCHNFCLSSTKVTSPSDLAPAFKAAITCQCTAVCVRLTSQAIYPPHLIPFTCYHCTQGMHSPECMCLWLLPKAHGIQC